MMPDHPLPLRLLQAEGSRRLSGLDAGQASSFPDEPWMHDGPDARL